MSVEQALAADPTRSVWVGASAGTGKTKVLTDRVLRLMLAGAAPERILCITFTKAAAAEMALRLSGRLARWATADAGLLTDELFALLGRRPAGTELAVARRLFARLLDAPGGMNIQTIHSLCQSLLRRFPLEAGLPPHFELMDDRDAAELIAMARERLFAEAASDPVLGAAVDRLATLFDADAFAGLMTAVIGDRHRLGRMIEGAGSVDMACVAIARAHFVDPEATPEGELAAACRPGGFDEAGLRAAAQALLASTGKDDVARGRRLAAWLAASEAERVARFEDRVGATMTAKNEPRARLMVKAAIEAAPAAFAALRAEQDRMVELEDQRRSAATVAASVALIRVGARLAALYDDLKRRRARLDFDDLILGAGRLLNTPGIAPWVLYKLDGGVMHLLLDEAQDTSPEQWTVVERLTEEFFVGDGNPHDQAGHDADGLPLARTVFAVGDPKQSIYRFQRADPEGFRRMQAFFQARVSAAERGWSVVALRQSFRSVAAVLAAVDAVFATPPASDGVVEPGQVLRHEAARIGQAGIVELWPLAVAEKRDTDDVWLVPEVREPEDDPMARVADAIAGTIRGWLDRAEMLSAAGRRLRPGDVLILVQRRNAFVGRMARALKAAGVPVAGVDRMALVDQIAVADLVALGRALLLPEDDLTLAAALKGPILGLDEDALYRAAVDRTDPKGGDPKGGRLPLIHALRRRAAGDPALAAAAGLLTDLARAADRMGPYDFYADLLAARGGRTALVARLGPEAEDAIDEFLNLALAYEQTEPPSLEGFLAWVERSAVEVKRDLEQGRDEVRIMTVHGAKGLQAPVVFLPDTTRMPRPPSGPVWLDGPPPMLLVAPAAGDASDMVRDAQTVTAREDRKEYRRLLYVAMTRAADRLYVCGWHGKPEAPDESWYGLTARALAGEGDARPVEVVLPGGITGTGWRLTGEQAAVPPAIPAAATGMAVAEGPSLPAELHPDRDLPAEPVPPRPLSPSRPDDDPPPARSPLGDLGASRFRRGRLVHRLLQVLPDLPPDARADAAARFLAAPAHGLAAGDAAALAGEVMAVLDHPDFAAIFQPGSRAEVPLGALVGSRVVSGAVDRLLVTPDRILLVDYKTDRPPPAEPERVARHYLRQMAAYRAVLQRIYPGRAIETALVWTDGPSLMRLPDMLLDRWAPAELEAAGGDLSTPN
ncbi:double-strand break repair helicase AddA [Tistrella bauzanensis]|uniref:double-strand break repair helicase AddA n=1 Tax=Tistrella TaxID=171436 RepID=UPI0031F604A4